MSTQDELALSHARADADSSRAEVQRLAGIIAAERDKAQVVLSQKGILEVINADLLAALEEMPTNPGSLPEARASIQVAKNRASAAIRKAEEKS